MHLCHRQTRREYREGGAEWSWCGCMCVHAWKLMKNEGMRRLRKLPQQQWPPYDNKERWRNEKRE